MTLYARAIESRKDNPILKDEKAEEIAARLDELHQQHTGGREKHYFSRTFDASLAIHIPLRSWKFDEYTRAFIKKHPDCVVINLGCGMDTRFFRVDNQKILFFDVDLPEMIAAKRQFIQETSRYKMIGQSVLEMDWMDAISALRKPVIFLAEGLFMYLPEERVKDLVMEMQKRFPESELVCELTNRMWVEGFWGKISAMKLKRRLKMGKDAAFKFGVSDARELETWHDGIEFLEKWFYMDSNHPKLGWMRMFRNWNFFRDAQYTARYRLHAR